MRRIVSWGVVVASLWIVPIFAQAQEASVVEVPPAETAPQAGYDGKFFLQSADKSIRVNLLGRFQPWLYIERNQKKAGDTNRWDYTLRLRRAALGFQVIWDKLTADIAVARRTDSTIIAQPSASYAFHPAATVTAGVSGIPYDRINEASSNWLFMAEFPLTASQEDGLGTLTIARQAFGPPTDLVLRVDGDLGKRFSYAVGIGNGEGDTTLNKNNELSYGVRLVYHVLEAAPYTQPDFAWSENPQLSIGVGGMLEDDDATATETLPSSGRTTTINRKSRLSGAADVGFRWRGASLDGVFYYRREKIVGGTIQDTNNDQRLTDKGYYLGAGYFLVPKKFEVVATAAQIFREGFDNNANEFGGGVNWYIKGNNMKLTVSYTNILDYDAIVGTKNETIHKLITSLNVRI